MVRKKTDDNELIVAQDHDHPLLHSKNLIVIDINWISGEMPLLPFRCKSKCRYRQSDQNCIIERDKNGRFVVKFELSQRAVTPGQFIVFYKKNVCLGGGIIDSVY